MEFQIALLCLIAASSVHCTNFYAFDCGELNTRNLCSGQNISLYCSAEHLIKWDIPCSYNDSMHELDFNSQNDVGDNKTCDSFRAYLTAKDEGGVLISSLTFTLQLWHNNTNITCVNGYTGMKYTCSIIMAGKASKPIDVTVKKEDDSMELKWKSPEFLGGVPINCYDITVSPLSENSICSSEHGSYSVPDTEHNITINGLGCESYNITVQAKTCVGHGSSYKYSIYSELPKAVHNLIATGIGSIQWDQPFNGGETIFNYIVSSVNGSDYWNTTNTSFNKFSGLSNGEHNISVQAVNCHGEGDPAYVNISIESNSSSDSLLQIILPATFVPLFVILSFIIILILAVAVYKRKNCSLIKISKSQHKKNCDAENFELQT